MRRSNKLWDGALKWDTAVSLHVQCWRSSYSDLATEMIKYEIAMTSFKQGSFCKNLLFGSGNGNNRISSFNAICIFSASFFCNVDFGPRNAMNKLGMSVSWFLTNSIGKFYCNSAKIQHTFPPGRSQISPKSLVERMSNLKRTRLTGRLKVKQKIFIGLR